MTLGVLLLFKKQVWSADRFYDYVLIHYVQTNVNYLPLKYLQNQEQQSMGGSHADPNTFITLFFFFFFLKIHFKRTI